MSSTSRGEAEAKIARVGILDYLKDAPVEQEIFGPAGVVTCFDCASVDELPAEVGQQDVLMLWHTLHLTRPALERLDSCRAIVRVGVGVDNVDLAAAGELGIPVVNVPDYGTHDVADHTMALLLALMRQLSSYELSLRRDIRQGWDAEAKSGFEIRRLTGLTLGIVGFGRIGSAVAHRARNFGLRVAFYDPYVRPGIEKSWRVRRCEDLEQLLADSDIVSLHVPLTAETREMIDSSRLERCRNDLVLVNTSRGPVVDLDAVHDALREGRLSAFAADVLPEEPPRPEHGLIRAYSSDERWQRGRVLLTPHVGSYSRECRRELREKAAQLARSAATGQPLPNCVNARHLIDPRTPIRPRVGLDI